MVKGGSFWREPNNFQLGATLAGRPLCPFIAAIPDPVDVSCRHCCRVPSPPARSLGPAVDLSAAEAGAAAGLSAQAADEVGGLVLMGVMCALRPSEPGDNAVRWR